MLCLADRLGVSVPRRLPVPPVPPANTLEKYEKYSRKYLAPVEHRVLQLRGNQLNSKNHPIRVGWFLPSSHLTSNPDPARPNRKQPPNPPQVLAPYLENL